MIFLIARILAFFGMDIQRAQKLAIWILIGLSIIVLIIVGLFLRSCFTKTPKLNQQQTIKAQQAVAKGDRKEMLEVLAESDAEEKAANDVQANAQATKEQAIQESKQKWSEASNDEMAKELERRAKESQ
jgi:biopolymer transport protein ExbB/TolQ